MFLCVATASQHGFAHSCSISKVSSCMPESIHCMSKVTYSNEDFKTFVEKYKSRKTRTNKHPKRCSSIKTDKSWTTSLVEAKLYLHQMICYKPKDTFIGGLELHSYNPYIFYAVEKKKHVWAANWKNTIGQLYD